MGQRQLRVESLVHVAYVAVMHTCLPLCRV